MVRRSTLRRADAQSVGEFPAGCRSTPSTVRLRTNARRASAEARRTRERVAGAAGAQRAAPLRATRLAAGGELAGARHGLAAAARCHGRIDFGAQVHDAQVVVVQLAQRAFESILGEIADGCGV